MRRLTLTIAALAAAVASAAAADDQAYNPGGYRVPQGHLPPPGACRVWYPDRPPGRQPAPTDCALDQYEAARYGGRVIYGGRDTNRRWAPDQRQRRGDRDRRWERDGDDGWVRVCVARDRQGRCVRTEVRRR